MLESASGGRGRARRPCWSQRTARAVTPNDVLSLASKKSPPSLMRKRSWFVTAWAVVVSSKSATSSSTFTTRVGSAPAGAAATSRAEATSDDVRGARNEGRRGTM
jgi:hypothetical protein